MSAEVEAASPIAVYAIRRVLLGLHAAGALLLLFATARHGLLVRRYLVGRFDEVAREKRWARVVAFGYLWTFALGATLYPSYRYHVRGLYLDRHAPVLAGLFDVKESYAALTFVVALGLGALASTLRPSEERWLIPVYASMSVLVCAVVWLDAAIGVLVVAVGGIG
jgi:hypothetical protein